MAYAGKNTVIIGGSHGLGLATAKAIVSQGGKLILTGRRPEPAAAAEKELNSIQADSAVGIQSDITSHDDHAEIEKRVESFFGTGEVIDFLFVNVGYAGFAPAIATTAEFYDMHFDTNTRGPIFLTQRLVPHMRPGSSIVFTTSVSIGSGYPTMGIYSASKAAIYSYAQTLAAELARRPDGKAGIRVNSLSPGFMDTPSMGVRGLPAEDKEKFLGIGASTTPMGRVGTQEEVAKAAVWLGFDATYTTGTELLVDGGSRYLGFPLEGH
ncbi:hypothetical protein FQN57_001073 [Myotisia sp. PD_48]|nr:hypothetical protein FQN57_001073 [Myotisia sp. PD_48]